MENLKKISAVLILFTIVLAFSAVNAVHALGVTATVTVGNLPGAVAYDSAKSEIFVANEGSGTVSVISDSAITSVPTPVPTPTPTPTPVPTPVSTTIPIPVPTTAPTPFTQVPSPAVVANVHVGNYPFGVAYDSGKDEIFVTNNYDDTVSVISDSDNTVEATIPVGEGPYGVAYDSGKGEIFVADNYDNTTSVISDGDNTVVATIPIEAPYGVAYDSGKSEIFVTNSLFEPSLLNPTTNFISNTVSLILDSSSTSASPAPATSVSPTSTVPEFSTEALILLSVVMVTVTFCTVASAYKKLTRPNSKSKQTTK